MHAVSRQGRKKLLYVDLEFWDLMQPMQWRKTDANTVRTLPKCNYVLCWADYLSMMEITSFTDCPFIWVRPDLDSCGKTCITFLVTSLFDI